MKIELYLSKRGSSPIENFISDLPKGDQARFADVFEGQTMIWLHVFKKTTLKTPLNNLDLAEK